MKCVITVFGIGALTLMAASAAAADRYSSRDRYNSEEYYGPYMGASAGALFYKEDGLDTMSPTIAEFRIGQQFSPYLAVEGRIGTSINRGEWNGFRINADAIYGGYAKGMVPVNSVVSIYGLAGIAGVQWRRNYPDDRANDAGLSFGLGSDLHLGGGAALTFEWLRVTSDTNNGVFDYTADQLSFGVTWIF